MNFTIADLDEALKTLNPLLADSVSFAARRTSAAKQALLQLYVKYKGSNDVWARASTLGGTAPATGSAVATTTNGAIFRIVLITGALQVADDVIMLSQGTAEFQFVPRILPSAIVQGASPTKYGFWENSGEIVLFTDDSANFTPPGTIHYDYIRIPTIDTSIGTNTIDIRPEDLNSFINSVSSFMAAS